MEFRQLRYFVAVADELHFGRAAESLHMSQPPLSVQVRRLEEEIGIPLFERSTRKVTLTAAGRHLQNRARQVIDEFESVRLEMREYADGLSGELHAGFVSSASYTVLPGVVRAFRALREGVTLTLAPLTSGEQINRLLDGSLDVGIVRDEPSGLELAARGLISEVVYEEGLVACLPVGHPLANESVVTAANLSDIPMISYPASLMPGYVARVAEVFARAAPSPTVVEEVVHQETALGFVAAGLGMTILPESVRQLIPPSIAVVPLAGSPKTQLIAIWPARPERAMICVAFVQCLRDVAEELSTR